MKRAIGYYDEGLTGQTLSLDAATYVARKADEELYQFLIFPENQSRICYILAPPQMGKSSLMARTAKRLTDEGAIAFQVALKHSQNPVSEDLLYFSILKAICTQLNAHTQNLIRELEAQWQEWGEIPTAQRFSEFFTQKIIPLCGDRRVIIFIDKIQYLMAWKLSDPFIAAIRAWSESEAEPLGRVSFALFGVATPSEWFTDADSARSAKRISLDPLTGDCQPLQPGLTHVTDNPLEVLEEILYWTGGQPFLTQFLCDLVAKQVKIHEKINVRQTVEELVKREIFPQWREYEKLSSHFQAFENWFISSDRANIEGKLDALNLYERIRENPLNVKVNEANPKQMDLLSSGLVVKSGRVLEVANWIYQQIFNPSWIERLRKILVKKRRNKMPIPQLYNRDVFILIDRSGSMTITDAATGGKNRWQYLQETVQGHVYEILTEQDEDYGIICDEVTLYFFNRNQPPSKTIYLRDAAQVQAAFKENKPGGATYLAPTLNEAVTQWFTNRTDEKGAFIIIYTDGQIDDSKEFVNAISKTCSNINSQEEIKILTIGVGSDIQTQGTIKFYLDIDFNTNKFKSRRGEDCNIFVFDLIDDVMDEGIIAALERQLEGDPTKGIASWVKDRYPDLYNQYFGS